MYGLCVCGGINYVLMEELGDCELDCGDDEGDQYDMWQQLDGIVQCGGGYIFFGCVEVIVVDFYLDEGNGKIDYDEQDWKFGQQDQ